MDLEGLLAHRGLLVRVGRWVLEGLLAPPAPSALRAPLVKPALSVRKDLPEKRVHRDRRVFPAACSALLIFTP